MRQENVHAALRRIVISRRNHPAIRFNPYVRPDGGINPDLEPLGVYTTGDSRIFMARTRGLRRPVFALDFNPTSEPPGPWIPALEFSSHRDFEAALRHRNTERLFPAPLRLLVSA